MVGQEILVLFIAVRICLLQPWIDGRVAEYTGLENRHTSNRIGGSNPSLSATVLYANVVEWLQHNLAKVGVRVRFSVFAP